MSEENNKTRQENLLTSIDFGVSSSQSSLRRIEITLVETLPSISAELSTIRESLAPVIVYSKTISNDLASVEQEISSLRMEVEFIRSSLVGLQEFVSLSMEREEKEKKHESLGYSKHQRNIARLDGINMTLTWTNIMIATYIGFSFIGFLYRVIFK